MAKNKLKQLLERMTGFEGSVNDVFVDMEKEITALTNKMKESVTAKALDQVSRQFEKIQEKFKPILAAIEELKTNLNGREQQIFDDIQNKNEELKSVLKEHGNSTKESIENFEKRIEILRGEIAVLNDDLTNLTSTNDESVVNLKTEIENSQSRIQKIINTLSQDLEKTDGDVVNTRKDFKKEIETLQEVIKKLRGELMSQLSNVRGGNMNRNIAIGGNTSVLSRYTDINIKPGTNVTLTYSNNDTTKYLDLTITSSGGSVGGTVRQIQTLIVSSQIGTLAGTDQVYLCNAGIQVTLPTAVSDTNLYTIKNVGTSSVLINTVSAQTIDNDTTVVMPVRYTSVDIVSDNSNWNLT